MRPIAALRTPALLALCAGSALAQPAYEVSEDGLLVAEPSTHEPVGAVARGSGVPFGVTPDQSVILRRQIGGLQIADINNDGFNDVIAGCYTSNSFPPYEDWHDLVFFGNGAGIDTTPGWISAVQTHTGDVQVGDVTGDGLPDIVTVHGGSPRSDSVRVYAGVDNAPPAVNPVYTCATSLSVWGTAAVIADMDNDGDNDLVTTNQGLSPDPFRPMLMFRNTAGVLSTNSVWQSAEASIQNGVDARDITGDGFPELAVAKWVNFTSGLYFNTTGTPDTVQSVSVGTTDGQRGAMFADFDDDSITDIAIGGEPTHAYAYVHGALIENYTAMPPFDGPQDLRVFDVDGDGDEDLAEIIFGDGKAHIYLNDSGTLSGPPSWTFDAPEVGTAMAFGDLNNDGHADLVLGYSGDTCIRVFLASPPPCPADLAEPSGVLNFFDIQAYIALFNAMDPAADLAEPIGTFNFFDIQAYIAQFNNGCP